MNKKNVVYALLMAVVITSCKVIQPYKTPDMQSAGLYRDIATNDTTTIANLHWNQLFTDTILQHLITEGIAQNLDLQVAYTRVEQARAYYEQSRLAFFPTLNTDVSTNLLQSPNSITSTNTSTNNKVSVINP